MRLNIRKKIENAEIFKGWGTFDSYISDHYMLVILNCYLLSQSTTYLVGDNSKIDV